MNALWVLVGLVVLQRLGEMVYAGRNTQRLLAQGAKEAGAGHYPLIVGLHVAWLVSILLHVPPETPVSWPFLAVFLFLQALRAWVLVSLGRFWTTRIITLPGTPLVLDGPYRYVRHPNYMIVAAEIAVLPLIFGAWEIALIYSVFNLGLTGHRIRVENRALEERRAH
ncbi:MAG: isoprenylcysteine carboxylmethyltransferase family protein [Rhodospirillales bacterium]